MYAFKGIGQLLMKERNFQVHVFALACVIALGIYFKIQVIEWVLITIVSSIILALEGMNTAIEKLCDEVTTERKKSIMIIKDVAAGAVLIAAIGAAIVGVLIFWKYISA